MEAKGITLRPIAQKDVPDLAEILKNDTVKKTYMVPDLTDEEAVALAKKIAALSEDMDRYVRGIYLEDTLIGMLNDVNTEEGTVELGWALHPDYYNRGYATQAVRLAIQDTFSKGYSTVEAGAFPENAASMRVMEKAGMVRQLKTEDVTYRGVTHSCIFYAIKRKPISLETEQLVLCNVSPEDAPVVFHYRNDERCARFQRGQTIDLEGIKTLLERRQFDTISDRQNFMIAVRLKQTGEFVGEIVVMPNDGCFSIGYTFHYAHHRKGYAYEALKSLTEHLHTAYPAMEFISFTEPENLPSRRLLEKLGYEDLGYVSKVTSQMYGKWLSQE